MEDCYICKENKIENLINLCNCSLFVHESCLLKWSSIQIEVNNSTECPQCLYKYIIIDDTPLYSKKICEIIKKIEYFINFYTIKIIYRFFENCILVGYYFYFSYFFLDLENLIDFYQIKKENILEPLINNLEIFISCSIYVIIKIYNDIIIFKFMTIFIILKIFYLIYNEKHILSSIFVIQLLLYLECIYNIGYNKIYKYINKKYKKRKDIIKVDDNKYIFFIIHDKEFELKNKEAFEIFLLPSLSYSCNFFIKKYIENQIYRKIIFYCFFKCSYDLIKIYLKYNKLIQINTRRIKNNIKLD